MAAMLKKAAASAMATRPAVAPRAAGRTMVVPKASMASSVRVLAPASAMRGAQAKRTTRASVAAAAVTAKPRANIGDSLSAFLAVSTDDPKLRQLMTSLSEAIRTIAHKVRTASCGSTSCVNSFGDEQLNVDMVADGLLFEALKYSHCCSWACSEEVPEPVDMGGTGYSVAFDPLDGSSIVDTNFAVGTIFGIWPGDKLVGVTGRDQAAAGMGIYGPRTVFVVAMKGFPGTFEFLLQDDGKWMLVKETTEIAEGKLYAPGNLRAIFDNPEYKKLVDFYLEKQYTLRYTGGMVPDVFQILVKEKGVFTNVTSPTTKAKLRLLFEVAPLALLVENAGGASSCDGLGVSGLDVEITKHDQRTQICYGSVGEVARFEKYMLGSSPRFAELAAKITVPN